MRHKNAGRNFSRTSSHRKAMFSNMCSSLIENEIIRTTLPKAKELRKYIEPLVTISREDTVASRRQVFNKLRSKSAVGKLFTILGPRYIERPGGYVRVLKCGFRAGDNAPMAYIEFVDRPVDDDEIDSDIATSKVKKSTPSEEVSGKDEGSLLSDDKPKDSTEEKS